MVEFAPLFILLFILHGSLYLSFEFINTIKTLILEIFYINKADLADCIKPTINNVFCGLNLNNMLLIKMFHNHKN